MSALVVKRGCGEPVTWFKTDDEFWRGRKVLGRRLSLAARGLWITAGSWSADNLTDGHVPAVTLYEIVPGTRSAVNRLACELVDAQLWEVVEDGWQFHDWPEYQPSAATVRARRASWKARQDKARGNVTPISEGASRRESR